MKLADLVDANWNSYERKRFVNDDPKQKTDSFDPESFKHEGFNDRDRYVNKYVPALAEHVRLDKELDNFTPPRLASINSSAYQALVIRFGILRTLIKQPGFNMKKGDLLGAVQSWQRDTIERYSEGDFGSDDALHHLSQAAVSHRADVDDSELNMIYEYMRLHNQSRRWKHEFYDWEDVFHRLSTIDRFPKVSRSEKPEHAQDTIEKGLWSLQEQALVYEIVDDDRGDVVGIPEEYSEVIAEWLQYEISEDNYLSMLESLEPFDRQSVLVETADTFSIEKKNHGKNQKRRENIVDKGVYPSDLFNEILSKEDLKRIVDQFGLDAHKRRKNEMIEKTIEYFEESQRRVDSGKPGVGLFLEFYEDISSGGIADIPPQLQELSEESDLEKKLEILFEEATAEIFTEIFNLEGTELLGQQASGTVADGQIEQDGKWLLWDNKRRKGKFKLGSTTRSKIRNYIETKNKQHDVQWFLIIAPEFSKNARQNANVMEKQLDDTDIRLVKSDDFEELARFWQESFGELNKEFPLSMFNGSDTLDVNTLTEALKAEFS